MCSSADPVDQDGDVEYGMGDQGVTPRMKRQEDAPI